MKAVPANRYLVFFSIAVAGCLVDLATKRWIFDRLGVPPPFRTYWVVEDVFGFQTNLNEGALFGIGQGMAALFAAMSVGAAAGILVWLFYLGAAREWLLTVALGCVTAGIFGNLYDRLGLPGLVWKDHGPLHQPGEPVYAVRDWILVMIGRWPWPTFNIADSLLVCGVGLLLYHGLFCKPSGGPDTADPA